MAAPLVIVGQADRVPACTAFFRKFGFEPAAWYGATPAEAEGIAAALGVPAAPFDACAPEALRGHCVVLASDDLAFQDHFLAALLGAGCSPRSLVLHPGLHSPALADLIEAITPDGAPGPNAFVQHLLDHYPESGFNPIRVLADLVSARIRTEGVPGRKTLAVYYPDAAYRANLGSEAMYGRIRDKGYNVVFLSGTKCRDEYERRQGCHLVGQAYRPLGILTYLEGIDLLIVPTAMDGLPERARVVLSLHDIFDSPVERDILPAYVPAPDGTHRTVPVAMTKADSYDYLLVPSTAVMDAQNQGPATPMTRRNRVAIPSGYMKLDHNLAQLRKAGSPVDSIIYATTVMKHGFSRFTSLPDHGEPIVAALLGAFPDHNIIFRPHPHTYPFKCVSDIVARFSGDPRFIFDDDATEYMPSYARSAVMVSDMSGTAFTYAFSTLRPVVFYSPNEADGIEEAFQGVSYFRHRTDIGFVTTSLETMVDRVRHALDHPGLARGIEAFRASMMFNIGRTEDYLVESVDTIMAGDMLPAWRALPSLKYCGALEDPTRQGDQPMLLETGYKGFNIVLYRGSFYGLSLKLGPVHLQELEAEEKARLVERGLCAIGASIQDVKAAITSCPR